MLNFVKKVLRFLDVSKNDLKILLVLSFVFVGISLVFEKCALGLDAPDVDAVLEYSMKTNELLMESNRKQEAIEAELITLRSAMELLVQEEIKSVETREGVEDEILNADSISDIDCLVYGDLYGDCTPVRGTGYETE